MARANRSRDVRKINKEPMIIKKLKDYHVESM